MEVPSGDADSDHVQKIVALQAHCERLKYGTLFLRICVYRVFSVACFQKIVHNKRL